MTSTKSSSAAPTAPPKETGFYGPYKSFATTLRAWLVAYGIGAPVLFASQDAFAQLLARPEVASPILLVFLTGVVVQVAGAWLFKVCMWNLYVAERKPEYEGTLMYKLSYRIADTIWPDVIIDVVSVGCYAWATYQVLADYVSPVTGASA